MKNQLETLTTCTLAVVCSSLSSISLATTITVTDPSTPAVANGLCSIVEALDNANADANVHADCSKGNGADTIKLKPSTTYVLASANNATFGPTGLPVITSTITINGFDSTIKRDTNKSDSKFRLVAVGASGKLTLNDLTLSGGLTGWPPEFPYYDCGLGLVGAGILNFGSLKMTNSRLSDNASQAFNGGGLASSGTATLYSTEIANNSTADDGAGIAACGKLAIFDSQIGANSANEIGGGVLISSGEAYIDSTTILRNDAVTGGGISNSGSLSLVNSTVAYNNAGSRYSPHFGGGGIANQDLLRVFNSTISNNSAKNGIGGGIYNNKARSVLVNTTVAGNAADEGSNIRNNVGSDMDLQNTLIADKAGPGLDCHNDGIVGMSLSSLVEDASCPSAYIGDPKLGPLTNNGGKTSTHALLPRSIAIDKGNDGICKAKPINNLDQRGSSRLADGDEDGAVHCDIGAYEKSGPQI